jgi:hypothetical protein
MEKTLIIIGNIDFIEESEENEEMAIVNKIDFAFMLPKEIVEEVGEAFITNGYDSYIIPTMYNSQILWKQD